MVCTIKIEFNPKWDDFNFELKKLIKKFGKPTKGNPKHSPVFFIENFRVTTHNKLLFIEGSLAKYFNGNNIDIFQWSSCKAAIKILSSEIGLRLEEGIIRRIDIGVNFELREEVKSYFPEIFHLDFFQRTHKKQTTLRFENNSNKYNFCFYDKKIEVENRRNNDFDQILVSKYKNLMRVELQIQERLKEFLNRTESVKVSELFEQDFCKLLMQKWLKTYQKIQKKGITLFPIETKGLKDYELLMKREFIEKNGWSYSDHRLEQLVRQGSITRKDKCEKRKQYKNAMLDKRPFIYQNHINELNHKMKVMYVEGLKQIYKKTRIC